MLIPRTVTRNQRRRIAIAAANAATTAQAACQYFTSRILPPISSHVMPDGLALIDLGDFTTSQDLR